MRVAMRAIYLHSSRGIYGNFEDFVVRLNYNFIVDTLTGVATDSNCFIYTSFKALTDFLGGFDDRFSCLGLKLIK